MIDLKALHLEAKRKGWVSGRANRFEIEYASIPSGWKKISVRRGDPEITQLRPSRAEDAKPQSLSAIHGMDAQPLHTDGAHLRVPPKVIVLHAEQTSTTPTMLLRYPFQHGLSGSDGLFLVASGEDRFLAIAYSNEAGLRFDPGCMTPQDQRARQLHRTIEEARTEAEAFNWSEPNTFLMIDNTRVLHGRAAVSADDEDRTLTRIAFHTKDAA